MRKRVFKTCVNILTVVFLLMVVSVWVLKQTGVEAYTILSGSMEPTLHKGDLVLVDTRSKDIQCDDIIAFYMGGHVVIHRVVEIRGDGLYVTKGDANENVDLDLVESERIIGSMWIFLRNMKWLWIFFTSKYRYWAIAVLAVFNFFAEDFCEIDGGAVVGNG